MPEDDSVPSIPGNRQGAFERAYLLHFPPVRNFLRIYMGSNPAADDLAQDTFMQFWAKPEAFDAERGGLRTYLLGIARKKAADWWRHAAREPLDAAPDAGQPCTNSVSIKDALARLEPDFRNILWLREAEGYSYEELSRLLEIPLGTVRSRLFNARQQLCQIWKSPSDL